MPCGGVSVELQASDDRKVQKGEQCAQSCVKKESSSALTVAITQQLIANYIVIPGVTE